MRFFEYLAPKPLAERKGPILLNPHTGKPVSSNWIYRHFAILAERAKISESHRWHDFRKACFTEMARNGATLAVIMELAGWDNADTANHYIGELLRAALESHRNHHPGHEANLYASLGLP